MNLNPVSFRLNRLRISGIVAGCLLSAAALIAQSPKARIQSEVNSSELAVLKGSLHPQAIAQNDAGRVPADTELTGITLYFNRSAAQQADLNALLTAQQDPSSPLFHQWLTPEQFAARFGVAQSDIDKAQAWLEQQGFAVDSVTRSRNGIRFSGTVREVESAFQTQMHYFAVNGEKHFAPSTALSVPAALAPVISGVRNLDNFKPRPQHINMRQNFTSAFTSSSSGNVFFAPGDIQTAYDIKPLYSGGVDGTGQTIAIMGQSFVHLSDVEAFQAAAGLKKKDPAMVLVPGTGNDNTPSAGDQSESDLDLEWSGAIAPGAKVVFVYTGSNQNYGVYDSIQYAVDNKIGNIISISYSSCETELNTSSYNTIDAWFQQAAAQGQTVMAASGDQGSTACSGDTHLSTTQQQALAVNYPASSAYVTGVGGTEVDMTKNGASNSTYWQSASGSDVISSAKQYIPEIVWNDDSSQFGLSSTGGGPSVLVSRPSWQSGVPGIPSGTMRLVPDISFYSSPDGPGYLYCSSDSTAWGNGQKASCNSGFRDSTSNLLTVAGGTSFATPIFAGMVALLNQSAKYPTGSGNVNSLLYKLAANATSYSSIFHDVTSGDNNCSAGAQYCGTTTGGFSAGAGFDQATGLGSVDVAKLAEPGGWPVNTGSTASLVASDVAVTPASGSVNSGTDVVFTITVTSATGGTPTGHVDLQIDGGTAWGSGGTTVTNQALSASGTVTYTANFTTAGTHQVLAQYSGDATHAAATGIGQVVISGGTTGKGAFTLHATDLSVKRGSSGTSTITLTPSGGYTGTVNLTFATNADTTLQNLCYQFTTMTTGGDGTMQVGGTAPVTTQLTLDTNASDCATAGAISSTGMHQFKTLLGGANLRAHLAAPAKPGNTPGRNPLPAGIAFAGLALVGLLGRKSRALRNLVCVAALAAAGFVLSACSSTTTHGPQDPPAGTYTVTVTGTDSSSTSVSANTTFSFTIQ